LPESARDRYRTRLCGVSLEKTRARSRSSWRLLSHRLPFCRSRAAARCTLETKHGLRSTARSLPRDGCFDSAGQTRHRFLERPADFRAHGRSAGATRVVPRSDDVCFVRADRSAIGSRAATHAGPSANAAAGICGLNAIPFSASYCRSRRRSPITRRLLRRYLNNNFTFCQHPKL